MRAKKTPRSANSGATGAWESNYLLFLIKINNKNPIFDALFPYNTLCGTFIKDGKRKEQNLRLIFIVGKFYNETQSVDLTKYHVFFVLQPSWTYPSP